MATAFELIEKVHMTFSSKYGLKFFITDEVGEIITSVESDNAPSHRFFEEKSSFYSEIKTILKNNENIDKTIIYEVQSGRHVIVSPVSVNEGINYYLWGGILKDDFTYTIGEPHEKPEKPVLKSGNRSEWLRIMDALAQLSALCLKNEVINPLSKIHIDKLRENFHAHQDITADLFNQITSHIGDMDFIGLAEQTGEDVYIITTIAGEGADRLKGLQFHTGEGFLGRAVLSNQRSYWESIGEDRRSKIFKCLEKPVMSLFTETLKLYEDSSAVLFGGSFYKNNVTSTVKAMAQMTAVLVESSLLVGGLRQQNSQQLTRLSSLIEICRLMSSTPDPKRMVLILLDISINLVEGPFSSMVLNDTRNGKGRIITRGTFYGDIKEYVRDIMIRTNHLTTFQEKDSSDPQIQTLPNGEKVIECPLAYGSELMGVLSVGIKETKYNEIQELLAFLQTLSIVGGVSLQLAGHRDRGIEQEKTEALQLAVAEFDKDGYERSIEVAELASLLVTRLEFSSEAAGSIVQACQLSYYNPSFIAKMFPEKEVSKVMETGQMIMDKEDVDITAILKKSSYIYALCNMYVKHHKIEDIDQLQKVDYETYEIFLSLVRTTHVSEEEFDLPTIAGTKNTNEIVKAVKNMKALSPREQEVLVLLSKGCNNQEIGEALYISTHTVKNHITKIFHKLKVSDRINAIAKVYRSIHN